MSRMANFFPRLPGPSEPPQLAGLRSNPLKLYETEQYRLKLGETDLHQIAASYGNHH